jgi:hypothetical protein
MHYYILISKLYIDIFNPYIGVLLIFINGQALAIPYFNLIY